MAAWGPGGGVALPAAFSGGLPAPPRPPSSAVPAAFKTAAFRAAKDDSAADAAGLGLAAASPLGVAASSAMMQPTPEDMIIAQLYSLNLPRPEVAAGLAQCLYPPPDIAQVLGLGPAPPGVVIGPRVALPPQFGIADPLAEAQQQQANAQLMVATGANKNNSGRDSQNKGRKRDSSHDFTLRMKNLPQNSNSAEIWKKYIEKGVEGITDVYLIPGKPFGFLRFSSEEQGLRALPLKIVVQGVAIDLEVATGKQKATSAKDDRDTHVQQEEEQHRQLQLQWKLMLQQQKREEKMNEARKGRGPY
eukprot:TRINITY_DN33511_c0_g1_i1.p1 TRINITY_DN33511_c0_g1~~TRINITY_DN33511_c0_g1_i1.p1  ORF type:complete len:303 (-),score=87.83 TRINITY_DN33511_c0_g1_i1:58-966(-)